MKINGPTLKAIREASGLSQVALSAATEGVVSQGRISEIESGDKVGAPMVVREATVKALATALRVPLTALTVPEQVAEPDEAA